MDLDITGCREMSRKHVPDVATQLREAMEDLFGFEKRAEEKRESKGLTILDFLEIVFAPDNLFAGLTLLLFITILFMSAFQSVAGLSPDYIGIIAGTTSGAIGIWLKLRSNKSKNKQSLSLVDAIMDRQFEYEKMQSEIELKKSQLNFFTQELIGLIGTCDPERLPSIDLALQALILDKEGIVHKELKEIKSLLSRRQAEEEVVLKKMSELKEVLPKNGELNYDKKLEMEQALQKADELQSDLDASNYRYDQLMGSLNVGVFMLNANGIITEANRYAHKTIPGIINGVGQHWTWNMGNRPGDQIKAMIKLISDAMICKPGKLTFINYTFSDGTKAKKLIIRAVPSCMGDIITHVFVIISIANGSSVVVDDEVKVIMDLENKASASLDIDNPSVT